MPTNNKTNAEKAAIKRRQRARRRAGIPAESGVPVDDLLGAVGKLGSAKPETRGIAKLTRRSMLNPTALNPEVASRILAYIVEGANVKTAARAAGIHEISFKRWMKRAEKALEIAEAEFDRVVAEAEREAAEAEAKKRTVDGDGDPDSDRDAEDGDEKPSNQAVSELSILNFIPSEDRVVVQFYLAVDTAEARCELRLLRKIAKGGRDWKANMTILERRFSERWAKEKKTTHEIVGDEKRPVVVTYESDEQRAMRVAAILQRANALEGNGREIVDREDDVLLPGPGEKE